MLIPAALLAARLLGALEGDAEARAGMAVRGSADGSAAGEAAELELLPTARGRLRLPTIDGSLTYAPRLALRATADATEPTLFHRAALAASWTAAPSIRVVADGSGSFGESDLVRVSDQPDAGGELRTVSTEATVRRFAVVAGLGGDAQPTERLRARLRASVFERGGLGREDRLYVPRERGLGGELRFAIQATPRDAHDAGATATVTEYAAGGTVTLTTLTERWRHAASRATEIWAEGGIAGRTAEGTRGFWPVDPLPIAAIGARHVGAAGASRLELVASGELRPGFNALSASVEQRAELRLGAALGAADGWTGRATASVARVLRPGEDGAGARLELQGLRALDRAWAVAAGAWIAQQRDAAVGAPAFVQWGLSVGAVGRTAGRGAP